MKPIPLPPVKGGDHTKQIARVYYPDLSEDEFEKLWLFMSSITVHEMSIIEMKMKKGDENEKRNPLHSS